MNTLFTLLASLFILSFTACSTSTIKPKTPLNTYEGKEVSAYLRGSYVESAVATEKLQSAGFEIVASYEAIKDGTTILFTNQALKDEASKPSRAHAALLRLFIDKQKHQISFTNPVYFGKAFMQDEYNHDVFNKQLQTIHQAFTNLKNSTDKLEFDKLAEFQFMMGMPHYEDSSLLAEASNEILLEKARTYKRGKELLYELKLSDNTTLLGYDLDRRTKKFVKKIGRENAALLPWSIVIENNKATALNAKYYIAISYPLLTMKKFMGIATVPGAIEKGLAKAFK